MVSDKQVEQLVINERKRVITAAAKAGMSETTARKYLRRRKRPGEIKKPHTWRTRKDPFTEVWEEAEVFLKVNPNLEVTALFAELQRRYPGKFQPGQLRTLQRKVKHWRATEGPSKEVFFEQEYAPGDRAQSDFTRIGHHDSGQVVAAFVVSLRAALFELGDGYGLSIGEL